MSGSYDKLMVFINVFMDNRKTEEDARGIVFDIDEDLRRDQDIDRGLDVFDLLLERAKDRPWYYYLTQYDGDPSVLFSTLFFTTTFFELQFKNVYDFKNMKKSERAEYEELVNNDDAYWVERSLDEMETDRNIEKLIYDLINGKGD